jgi:5-(carboxyamino)imidazole ribonucleotide synthase
VPVVGVIGGGQLARMMHPAAINLGVELRVFTEAEDSSAHQAAYRVGDYLNLKNLEEFCHGLDALTFDHEHVPTELLRELEDLGVAVRPGSKALIHAQNKLVMRERLTELGLPMPAWQRATSSGEVEEFLNQHGPKIVVKTPIGGYDGKGVRVIAEVTEISDWLSDLNRFGGALLLEQKVDFVSECAQLSARSANGEFKLWPLASTFQQDGVCSEVVAPYGAPELQEKAARIAQRISEGLGVVGVLAVEMFVTSEGELVINELAMRPHNSGHFTQDGCITSQFEQHLRAVLGWPLGDTSLHAEFAVMVNLLGVDQENNLVDHFPAAMEKFPGIKFHSYQKLPRAGRKMGHLNLVGQDPKSLLAAARAARELIYNKGQEV